MFRDIELREVPLSVRSSRQKAEQFLRENGLKPEPLDYFAGIFNGENLLAGGGLCGDVIKCVAVSPEARDQQLSNLLISHLRSVGYANGHTNLFVFTKPENENIFTSLSFQVIGKSSGALLLESDPLAVDNYSRELSRHRRPGVNGAIVMNCNPFTCGHQYLIQQAAAQVDALHIIVVEEDKSEFSFDERKEMVRLATAGCPNILIHQSGKYAVSSATFPRYFLKEADDVSAIQAELDLDLFTRHIAPALGVTVRFVGHEPTDPLTAQYNAAMKNRLPQQGIRVVEIERIKKEDRYISASHVRRLLHAFRLEEACRWVPPTSFPFLQEHCAIRLADKACEALRNELSATPKPGLVDQKDSGAHRDMDYPLMRKSIDTLYPYFIRLARLGIENKKDLSIEKIRAIGSEAEQAMLTATGGVNTHRGAIFSMGLCVVAAASLIGSATSLTSQHLSATIAGIAGRIEPQQASNGAIACRKYNIPGALEQARCGYRKIFDDALPLFNRLRKEGVDYNEASLRVLLAIMSHLEDTNVYHRGGKKAADRVKETARQLSDNFSITRLEELNNKYIQSGISPGGSADMLAIVLFLHEITYNVSL